MSHLNPQLLCLVMSQYLMVYNDIHDIARFQLPDFPSESPIQAKAGTVSTIFLITLQVCGVESLSTASRPGSCGNFQVAQKIFLFLFLVWFFLSTSAGAKRPSAGNVEQPIDGAPWPLCTHASPPTAGQKLLRNYHWNVRDPLSVMISLLLMSSHENQLEILDSFRVGTSSSAGKDPIIGGPNWLSFFLLWCQSDP